MERLELEVPASRLPTSAIPLLRILRPHWPSHHISFKVFTDGITNSLIGCWLCSKPNDIVLVRVYGENTDLLIDRNAETSNFKVLQKAGYAPQLYATFKNGIAYEYVPGEVLTTETIKSLSIFPLVAQMLARFHVIEHDPSISRSPVIWDKLRHYLSLIPSKYTSPEINQKYQKNFPDGVEGIEKEVTYLENHLTHLKCRVVFCHNDLLLANIIHSKEKVTFIDYEYAAYNYQAYDIGNHFAEFAARHCLGNGQFMEVVGAVERAVKEKLQSVICNQTDEYQM